MPLNNISKGTGPNTGSGTNARDAADIINNNFTYLEDLIQNKSLVKIGEYTVEKGSGNLDLTGFEPGDTFTAWLSNNTRYVVGVVKAVPFDLDDKTKVGLAINRYL